MAILPPNYPTECTDGEISQAINGFYQEIFVTGANPNKVLQLGPLIQIGLNELQKRATHQLKDVSALNVEQTRKLTEEVNKLTAITKDATEAARINQQSARRMTSIATWLTGVSIILAMIATFLAYETTMTDKRWQQQEIQLLQDIRLNTTNVR